MLRGLLCSAGSSSSRITRHSCILLGASTRSQSDIVRRFSAGRPGPLRFDNPEVAFHTKTTGEVFRGLLVLKMCTFNAIVKNAEILYKSSQTILGSTITNWLLKKTFFAHFCAGESEREIAPTMQKLREAGVGG
ncbi:hypothetical protein FOZ63_028480, partial [Perkinsus olseni]